MRRRMGRPGLVGTMTRTAVIAGTASAASGKVQQHQQAAAPAPPAAPEAPAAPGDNLMDQLEKLADMKASGLLDDAEFAAAKARLLGP